MKSVIKIHHNSNQVIINDFSINLEAHIDELTVLIKKYTENNIHGPLNQWLMSSDCYESIEYFTAMLMFTLNSYALKNNKFFVKNQEKLYRGIKIPYSSLIAYERAKGQKICLSAFTSTSRVKSLAENWSGRREAQIIYENNLFFSVLFEISNVNQKSWVSTGIDIQDISKYKDEKEVLFQPFSFYYVKDVKIDLKKYTADIYLETIGKKEILEEKIKNGNEIIFNENEKIIDIKKKY